MTDSTYILRLLEKLAAGKKLKPKQLEELHNDGIITTDRITDKGIEILKKGQHQ